MSQYPVRPLPPAQRLAAKAFDSLETFLHVEAVSGVILLIATAIALIWANSPAAASYEHLWHMPITIGAGEWVFEHSLHFWINEVLMTIFFLVVGMEIRREIHDGALQSLSLAALPVGAAIGGVAAPAILYLCVNGADAVRQGWAVPTATDIAFAVGVLALLGKSIPGPVRIFLLALAIIDDIIAVLIIAVFFGGIDPVGLTIAGAGILLVLALQGLGISSTAPYMIPGAVLWIGLFKTGIHPTLAGVVLGLMTPVTRNVDHAVSTARYAIEDFVERLRRHPRDTHELMLPIKHLKSARRALLPPVVRVQTALHPWVAFGIMPLFALANAGVNLDGVDLAHSDSRQVMLGISLALVLGKPLGIVFSSWILVRLGWCKLPVGMTWSWMLLIGCLGGIGFTMSIFIANLAFSDAILLTAAKLGVLLASAAACIIGLILGAILVLRHKAPQRIS